MSANDKPAGRPLLIGLLVIAAVAGTAALTKDSWYASFLPEESGSLLDRLEQHERAHAQAAVHGAHAAGSAIALSTQGLKNIGYEPFIVQALDGFLEQKVSEIEELRKKLKKTRDGG